MIEATGSLALVAVVLALALVGVVAVHQVPELVRQSADDDELKQVVELHVDMDVEGAALRIRAVNRKH